MKQTPLTTKHLQLGAKMLPFAGFNMPVEYAGIKEEHLTVRNGVGVFDVSHMGEFMIHGQDAQAFLQSLLTNDITKLAPGKAQYTCMTNHEGGIVDDLIVYMMDNHSYMLVVNGANIEKDWSWIMKHAADKKLTIKDESEQTALLAVQGPKSKELLQKLTTVDLEAIPFYSFQEGKLAGVHMIISNTGYTGSGGFELYIKSEDAADVWDELFKTGEPLGIKPIGLGARDTLRLEKGYCLYGNDLNDKTTPLEAGLGWITKLVDGNDFSGRAIIEKQKEEGITKRLVAFKMIGKGFPRKDYTIEDESGAIIGIVTSGGLSPLLEQGIGMGYIDKKHVGVGNKFYICIRKNKVEAEQIKLPFV